MSILIFGGTTEGRQLAQELSRRGVPTAVSVATPWGRRSWGSCPASRYWWGGGMRKKWPTCSPG